MDQHRTELRVLARFPDLNDGNHDLGAHKATGFGLLASGGRLIGQTTWIKLLAGTVLFLLVGAVLPFCIGKNSPPANSSVVSDSVATAQPDSAKAEAAPAASDIVAPTAFRPAVHVAANKEPSSGRRCFRHPPRRNPKPPLMSRWPNPATAELQPTRVGTEIASRRRSPDRIPSRCACVPAIGRGKPRRLNSMARSGNPSPGIVKSL